LSPPQSVYACSKQAASFYRHIHLGTLYKPDVNREQGYAQKVLNEEKLIQSVKPGNKTEI